MQAITNNTKLDNSAVLRPSRSANRPHTTTGSAALITKSVTDHFTTESSMPRSVAIFGSEGR